MIVVTGIALALLAASAVLTVVRLLRGPAVADRMVSLDSLLTIVVAGIAVGAARTGESDFLDVLVLTSLLGFVSTVTVARYLERRGDAEPEGDAARAEAATIEQTRTAESAEPREGRHGA